MEAPNIQIAKVSTCLGTLRVGSILYINFGQTLDEEGVYRHCPLTAHHSHHLHYIVVNRCPLGASFQSSDSTCPAPIQVTILLPPPGYESRKLRCNRSPLEGAVTQDVEFAAYYQYI